MAEETLSKLIVRMDVDRGRLKAGFEDVRKETRRVGDEMEKLRKQVDHALEFLAVREGITLLSEFVLAGAEAADSMGKFAQKVGMPTEQLSALAHAAKLSDVSTEDLGIGLQHLAKSAVEAASGGKEQAAAYRAMGIAVKDARGHVRPMHDLLADVADKFAGYKDGAEKSALAQEIFGKAGTKLIPLLNAGRDGLAEMEAEAKRLGLTISDGAAKSAEEFNDNLTRLKSAVGAVGTQLAAELTPALSEFTKEILDSKDAREGLHEFAVGLGYVLKGVVTAGSAAWYAISRIGKEIGKIAAQIQSMRDNGVLATLTAANLPAEVREIYRTMGPALEKSMPATFGRGTLLGGFVKELNAAGGVVKAFQDEQVSDWQDFKNRLDAIWNPGKRFEAGEDEVAARAKQIAEGRQAAPRVGKGDAKGPSFDAEILKERNALLEQGKALTESVRDAEETWWAAREKARGLYRAEAIDLATYVRALIKADEDLEKFKAGQRAARGRIEDAVAAQAMRDVEQRDKEGMAEEKRYQERWKRTVIENAKGWREQNELAAEAADRLSSVLADHMVTGFRGGLAQMLRDFMATLAQMAARVAAARIVNAAFGAALGGPVAAGGAGAGASIAGAVAAGAVSSATARTAAVPASSGGMVRHVHSFDEGLARSTLEQAFERHVANVRATR